MICIESGLYVVIQQAEHERAPQPLPLANGFSHNHAYHVLGVYSASETSEAYFILSNDRDEIWFISNRHLRTYKILPHTSQLYIALSARETPIRELRAATLHDIA